MHVLVELTVHGHLLSDTKIHVLVELTVHGHLLQIIFRKYSMRRRRTMCVLFLPLIVVIEHLLETVIITTAGAQ